MRKVMFTRSVIVALAGLLAVVAGAHAQGVGNIGALPGIIPMDSTGHWFIGTYGVVRDPNGPKWHKTLVGDPTGAPVTAQPGQIFSLSESLFIEGNLPWMDWHEEIVTPGWSWVDPVVFLANGNAPSGLSVTNIPGTAAQGGAIHFDFDPLFPGTKIDIRKYLRYDGPAGALFVGHIVIDQYPTPEPASAGLLGLGSVVLLRRRRRH